jgi:hypothetical protein
MTWDACANYDAKQLFRRIKHFSMYTVSAGYLVTE